MCVCLCLCMSVFGLYVLVEEHKDESPWSFFLKSLQASKVGKLYTLELIKQKSTSSKCHIRGTDKSYDSRKERESL